MTVSLLLLWVGLSAAVRYDGQKIFRFQPTTEQQLNELRALQLHWSDDLDFWQQPSAAGREVDVRVGAKAVKRFKKFLRASHNKNFYVEDLQKKADEFNFMDYLFKAFESNSSNVVGRFSSHDHINSWLDEQCGIYPNITQCGTWGRSFEGRDMRYIKVGKPSLGQSKQAVYVIAGMHAREWLGPATIIWIIDKMLSDYGGNSTLTQLMTACDWYFEPVVNPDGYEYSRQHDRMWRKTRSDTGNPKCPGVDGNRNFDYFWEGNVTADECSNTYAGHAPFSENETANIARFVRENSKTQSGLAFFTFHTFARRWLLPYGYASDKKPADYDELLRVGKIGSEAISAVHGQKWEIGNIVDVMYVAKGSTVDWFKGRGYATYSYGLELRGRHFIVMPSDIGASGAEVYAGLIASVDAMPKTFDFDREKTFEQGLNNSSKSREIFSNSIIVLIIFICYFLKCHELYK